MFHPKMHGQLWLVEHMPKLGDFEPLTASGQSMPEPSSSRIAWCHPALIAFMIGVSAS